MGGAPDRPDPHGRQPGEGKQDDVAALGQGQAGDGGVDDLAAGHQRECLVQAADGAGAADGPAGRGSRRDDGVVQGAGRSPGRLVVGQVLGRGGSAGHQRVVAADGEGAGPVLDGRPGGQIGFVDGEPADQDVDLITAQRPVQVLEAGFPQLDVAAGIGRGEGTDQAGQRRSARGQRETDAQRSRGPPRGGAGIIHGGQQLAVGRLPPVAQSGAERGKPDPAGGPVEQRAAGFPFQCRNQSAHPRLRQAQAFRGPAEVKLVGQHQECPHLRHVHGRDLDPCPDDINCCADRRRSPPPPGGTLD